MNGPQRLSRMGINYCKLFSNGLHIPIVNQSKILLALPEEILQIDHNISEIHHAFSIPNFDLQFIFANIVYKCEILKVYLKTIGGSFLCAVGKHVFLNHELLEALSPTLHS